MTYLWQLYLDESGEDFDPAYHLKPREEIIPLIDWTPHRVLDIGCGAGATGRLLMERFPGCELYGIEVNNRAASVAGEVYKHVAIKNVEESNFDGLEIPFKELDTVLLLDVLEHLYNPWKILAELRTKLTEDCRIVASIPNAFNIQLLEEIASGHWRYDKWGLLDITHIRFFTEEGMRELFEQTGYSLLRIESVPHPVSMLPSNIGTTKDQVETDHLIVKHLNEEARRDLFSIQKLIVAGIGNHSVQCADTSDVCDRGTLIKCRPRLDPNFGRHYLDLIRSCILGLIYDDPAIIPKSTNTTEFSREARELGRDWPSVSHSMIGNRRMLNLQHLAEHALITATPGDFIETGVWRGGACIMMRAVLQAYGVQDRTVWVADSFEGLPRPNPERYPADSGDTHFKYEELAVPIEKVRDNFNRYGLLDEQVVFLKGWFKDSLPKAPIEKLALMRLDGDMYESTMDALVNLFPKLSPGGFVIIDDFGYIESCRKAVHDYRTQCGITDPIYDIDGIGVFWQNLKPNRFSDLDLSDSELVFKQEQSHVVGSTTHATELRDAGLTKVDEADRGVVKHSPDIEFTNPPPSGQPFAEHRTLIKEASVLMEQGKLADAADILIGLVSAQTPVWEAYNDLAAIAVQQNDLETAEQLLHQAVVLAPVPSAACLNLAMVQTLQKRYEAALESLSPLLRAEANNFEALDLIRQILGAAGPLGPVAWARLLTDLRLAR